jgi:hypothetical protein
MKLSFFAKDDDIVYVPDFPRVKGAFPNYVGRSFVAGTPEKGAQHPATVEPFVCDSEDANGSVLLAKFRRGKRPLWPADKATADACGVEFVPVEVKDGIAVVKAASAPAIARKSAKDEV